MAAATPGVLLIGETAVNGLTGSIRRGFEAVGWRAWSVGFDGRTAPLLARAGARWPAVLARVRRQLTDAALAEPDGQVDLVLVVKGPFTGTREIDRLRRRTGAPVICWNADDPFDPALSNRGFGIPRAIAAYDAYVTWADDVAERIAARNRRVHVVPFGVDGALVHPVDPDPELVERVVFVGTWSPEREQALIQMAAHRPLVFGSHWPEVPGVERRPVVSADRLCQVLGSARWSVNLLRPQNQRSHNMRTFEIPACGGVQLAVSTPDHERFLAGTAVRLVDDFPALVDALGDAPPPREDTTVWSVENSYAARVRELLAVLGPLSS